jgi:hypothetical protein
MFDTGELERAQVRAQYARVQLERFLREYDPTDENSARQLWGLQNDLNQGSARFGMVPTPCSVESTRPTYPGRRAQAPVTGIPQAVGGGRCFPFNVVQAAEGRAAERAQVSDSGYADLRFVAEMCLSWPDPERKHMVQHSRLG